MSYTDEDEPIDLGVRGEDAWRVRRVWVKGNRRTRPDVVAACVKPVLKARTFDEVLARVAEAAGELKGLGIFKSVNLVLDDLPDDVAAADPSACDLRVELVEHKLTRIEVKTSTTVGENEPDVQATVGLCNAFGRAETVSVSAQVGASNWREHWSSAFSLAFKRPVSYEASARHVIPESSAPLALRSHAGHSLKSAVKYVYAHDTRDDPLTPTTGHAFTSSTELAGLGGDVRFVKQEMAAQLNLPLGKTRCSFNVLAKAGYLHALDSGSRIRALGGGAYWAGSLHLSFPLPLRDVPDFVSGHLFANAGNLRQPTPGRSVAANVQDLFSADDVRAAVGAGLVLRTMFGRVELNLSHPIRKAATDLVQPFQVGLSVRFL
ncbi:outer membrane protein, OMP85 family [Acanthamoeba castellanii str. Neff]|uniref:Outer membrane protein, OMP85 family n=1 Tax=Acanthamoeba castellanii (strain ATCC 30010 / Neff) TaxID=1257118 RepID=L8H0E8_ACACF|nr:outer membrane protein, OMP85 family [Acanthamoeba castellanii str. Neff]ELR18979.1 outer membrane protein, OMP85 family [Acanthamoeba castellanii str. Neff]